MNAEEAMASHGESLEMRPYEENKKKKGEKNNHHREKILHWSRTPTRDHQSWSPLKDLGGTSMSLEPKFSWRSKEGYLQHSRRMHALATKQDLGKYYRFHHKHDHNTVESIQHKNKIEVLLRHGQPDQYVNNQQDHEEVWIECLQSEENQDN